MNHVITPEDRKWLASIRKTDASYVPCSPADVPGGIRWDVPRRHQGQIVTVSYGDFCADEADIGAPFKRIHDASDGTTEYFRLPK